MEKFGYEIWDKHPGSAIVLLPRAADLYGVRIGIIFATSYFKMVQFVVNQLLFLKKALML
jgi:hypothetical protein